MALIDKLNAVGDAIRAKTGKSEKLTLDEMVTEIGGITTSEDLNSVLTEQEALIDELKEVLQGKAGVGGVEEKQIIFIDYDGTLLYSYTPEEVLALTELPSHKSTDELLIFDGWNWTLEDLKAEINLIGLDFMQNHKMAVGATYLTKDDISYFFITINGYNDYSRTVNLYGGIKSGASAKIDWGDGSDITSITSTSTSNRSQHIYASNGDYVVRVIVEAGNIFLSSNSTSASGVFSCGSYMGERSIVNKAYIGNVNTIYANGFNGQVNLKSIVISNKCLTIRNGAFSGCYSLKALVLPSVWESSSVGSSNGFAKNAASLEYVSFPNKALYPNTDYFRECKYLRYAHFPMSAASTDNQYLFYDDVNLESIIITQTADDKSAYRCHRLKQALVREGVTSLNETFYECYSLTEVKMPSTIKTLTGSVFRNCTMLTKIDFTACTSVPTLASASTFQGVPSTCKILVPASLYDEWIAATNWSSSSVASKIVAVEV